MLTCGIAVLFLSHVEWSYRHKLQPKSNQDFIDRSPFAMLLALPCSLGPDAFLRSVLLRHTSRADAWRKLVYQGLLGSVPMLLLIVYFVVCATRETIIIVMFDF